jgi:hypothetical protein
VNGYFQSSLRLGACGPTEATAVPLLERSRRDAIVQFARLIVLATKGTSHAQKKEVSDEAANR